MWQQYYCVTSTEEALQILAEKGGRSRLVAGATDLIIELERGVRRGVDTLVDISRIPGLDQISLDEDEILHLGPLATHNHCVASKLIVERGFPLAQAAWEVGAPQIRNRGTVAGNLITASPANDTITPLMALGANVRLASVRGERVVPLAQFYTGVRATVMAPDEMLLDIAFPALRPDQHGMFIKLGLRSAQAIAVVNVCALLKMPDWPMVSQATITLGAVAPTIIHASEAQDYLQGQELTPATIAHTSELAMQAARPIDDVRSSAAYRKEMVRVCVSRALHALLSRSERAGFPENPVLLWGKEPVRTTRSAESVQPDSTANMQPGDPIVTHINGRKFTFNNGHNKTLLHLLRDEAGLTGSKEGCAEGECGACTVFLDGKAVMSCLVPAGRAHGAEIVTVEGLSSTNGSAAVQNPALLHPIQQAFVEAGAVQCGYCTPGLLMAGAKLLEERLQPSQEDIRQAITGNLCRCTGYYKIVQAIELAAGRSSARPDYRQQEETING